MRTPDDIGPTGNCHTHYHERAKRDPAWWAKCAPKSPLVSMEMEWRDCCEDGCRSTLCLPFEEVTP